MKNRVSLWDYYDGEPFLENPHLVVINHPRRKKKGRLKMARRHYRKNARRHYRMSARRNARRPSRSRRNYRRNAYVLPGVVAAGMNPRRRRHYRHNPRRRHHYRRNPGLMGIQLPPMQSVLYASVGFFVPPTLEILLNKYVMPVSLSTSTVGKYVVRIAAVLGLSWGVSKLIGREQGKMVGIGGGAYIVTTALTEAGFSLQRSLGLAAYTGLPIRAGMGAYSAIAPGRRSLGAPPYGATRPFGATSAPMGGMMIVPQRFRRFQ